MTEKNTSAMNKLAVIQVLAGLMTNPLLFADNKYQFSKDDFTEQFHQIIFGAIDHLARPETGIGMQKIDYLDIDQFLKQYPNLYKIFCANNGIEYIQNCLHMFDNRKFDYYYQTLKKYSLLNKLNSLGFDTKDIYDPDILDPKKSNSMQEKFDEMSVNDILLYVEAKLITAKELYGTSSDRVENHAGDSLRELKERLKQTPDLGMPLMSAKLTTIYRGQRLGCLFMESAPSGIGKALPNNTKIPTPFGWKTVGDIRPNDYIFDAFGKPTRVIEIFPQGLKEVYEVTFLDGRKIQCCDEHLWSFNTSGQRRQSVENRKFYTKTLKEIINTIPLKTNSGWNVLVPQQKAVEYPERKHYLTPYVLGLLLGDGCLREQQTNKALTFSTVDTELANSIGLEMNWIVKKNRGSNSWVFGLPNVDHSSTHGRSQINIWVSDALREHPDLINTNSFTKFIPQEYLIDSVDNRFALLNGLLDTDGSVSANKGVVTFFTISPSLRDGVITLAQSLGFQTSVSVDTHKNTSVGYSVRLMGNEELKSKLFRLSRKHDRIMQYVNSFDNRKAHHEHNYNPIIDIKCLNKKEEMTCFLVDNEEHLFLAGDYIVTHNSRKCNGEACHLAVPEHYDIEQKKWVNTGLNESVLMISTELEEFECQQMWMAYVAGVPELHIKDGNYLPGEEERVDRAIELIEKSNLYFVSITNYDCDDIVNIIKKYKQLYNVNYVFFDYLAETLKINSSISQKTRVKGLRTDQILLMLSTALKDVAKQLGIYIWTSSQLSGDYKNAKDLDAGYLRSAKSLADKVDVGAIMMPVREMDNPVIDSYCAKGFETRPNFVMNVYKVRAGCYQNIKVYLYFNRETCQMFDCFVTNSDGVILPVNDTNVNIIMDSTKEESFANAFIGEEVDIDLGEDEDWDGEF